MNSAKPSREQADLAEVLELVLDKGIVINADIAVTVGETELLGVELRAAIASFETAAEYGLAFPSGTDMRRVEQASGREALDDGEEPIDLGIDASSGGSDSGGAAENEAEDADGGDPSGSTTPVAPARRPTPTVPTGDGDDEDNVGDDEELDGEAGADASDDTDRSNANQPDADSPEANQPDADPPDADRDADDQSDAGTEDA